MGYGIEKSPIDKPAERFLMKNIPHAEKITSEFLPTTSAQWSQPEKGLLGGSVVSVSDSEEESIQLKDTQSKVWKIDYSQESIQKGTKLRVNDEIKVIGHKEDEHTFRAQEIQNWEEYHSEETDSKKIERKREDGKEWPHDENEEDQEDTSENEEWDEK